MRATTKVMLQGGTEAQILAVKVVELTNLKNELLDVLHTVLPYIETAEEDKGYKPGAVNTISRQILAVIAKAEGRS